MLSIFFINWFDPMHIANSQRKIEKRFWFAASFFFVLLFSPLIADDSSYWQYPTVLGSLFLFISSIFIALIFRNRAKKMDTLKQGISLLAKWELSESQLVEYAREAKKESLEKNKVIISIIAFFFIFFTSVFLFFMDEDRLQFAILMFSGLLFPLIAAFLMPVYTFNKQMNGDRKVLIGKKFAYFNGSFHNWDYPLSGLTKTTIIKKPFYGIFLSYYYTDRTLTHSAELKIPAPTNLNLNELVDNLKSANKK
ncbi:MAG: hypothetical protein GY702_24775 [Desulfobulbaceae bacterium]|nr:hypothetical protein [Desulfobulbaceae bacterium]